MIDLGFTQTKTSFSNNLASTYSDAQDFFMVPKFEQMEWIIIFLIIAFLIYGNSYRDKK